jgi:hypothetical protein
LGVSRPYVSKLVKRLATVPIPVIVQPDTSVTDSVTPAVTSPTVYPATGTPQQCIESGDLQAIRRHAAITGKIAELAAEGDMKAARLYLEHIAQPYRADGQSKREAVPAVVQVAIGWLPQIARQVVNNSQLADSSQVIDSNEMASLKLLATKES